MLNARDNRTSPSLHPRSVVPGHGSFEVRELTGRDLARVAAYYLSLDETARIHRFHSPFNERAIVTYVNDIDLSRVAMIGAVDWETGALIGIAELHPGVDNVTAEAVVSTYSGPRRTLSAIQLMDQLTDVAATRGYERLRFDFHPEDRDTSGLLRRLGAAVEPLTGTAILSWCGEALQAA